MQFPIYIPLVQDKMNPRAMIAPKTNSTLHLFCDEPSLKQFCTRILKSDFTMRITLQDLPQLRDFMTESRLTDYKDIYIHLENAPTANHSKRKFLDILAAMNN